MNEATFNKQKVLNQIELQLKEWADTIIKLEDKQTKIANTNTFSIKKFFSLTCELSNIDRFALADVKHLVYDLGKLKRFIEASDQEFVSLSMDDYQTIFHKLNLSIKF